MTARSVLAIAWRKLSTARSILLIARWKLSTARSVLATARRKLLTARSILVVALRKLATAPSILVTALCVMPTRNYNVGLTSVCASRALCTSHVANTKYWRHVGASSFAYAFSVDNIM